MGSLYYIEQSSHRFHLQMKYGEEHANEIEERKETPITLLSTARAILWNWWRYPKEVRQPLRAALLHHRISPLPDSQKQAEVFYLLAYDAALSAKDDVDLRLVSGIALRVAEFYADVADSGASDVSPQVLCTWYGRTVEHLIEWHLRQSTDATVSDLETLVRLLATQAQHAPAPRIEPLYSMALSLCTARASATLPSHIDRTHLTPMLTHILRGKVPPFLPRTDAFQSSVSRTTLTHLLEHFAAYYDAQNRPHLALQLRQWLLASAVPAVENDPFCRHAHILNNLATNHVALHTAADYAAAQRYLEMAERQSQIDTDECQECYLAVCNNLGHVAELSNAKETAVRYFERALKVARRMGDVDRRRNIQAQLARLAS